MSASLVGSEMCIRDRQGSARFAAAESAPRSARNRCQMPVEGDGPSAPVSYTHLTLPTICSV
eukprot:3483749-Alexandrium_andersonii.AAC.1